VSDLSGNDGGQVIRKDESIFQALNGGIMPTGSFLIRRAIYQNLHSEGLSDGKTEIVMAPQVPAIELDDLNEGKKRSEIGNRQPAENKLGSASDFN
jgi:hypothetical protein